MDFMDLNDNGKNDAEDAYIYEEILLDEKKDKNPPEPTGCCIAFMALMLPSLFAVIKIFFSK